jgi:hypothetical protein
LVKDENGDIAAHSNNTLNKRKNFFSQLLNLYRVSDDRLIEIHPPEPLVSEPSPFEAETATERSESTHCKVLSKFQQN